MSQCWIHAHKLVQTGSESESKKKKKKQTLETQRFGSSMSVDPKKPAQRSSSDLEFKVQLH